MHAYPTTYWNFPNTLLSWSKTGWDNQLVKCQTKKAGEMLTQVLWFPKGKGFFPQSTSSADSHTVYSPCVQSQASALCIMCKYQKSQTPAATPLFRHKQTNKQKQKAKMQMLVGKGSYHLQGINEVSTRNGKSTLQYFDFSGCPCKHTGAPS